MKILVLMLFLHVLDDYVLQGVLSKMKQRSWWDEKTQDNIYNKDYVVALVCHSVSWSFMIHLPFFFVSGNTLGYIISFIVNAVIHGFVDHLKCNEYKINLMQDQLIHLAQIIFTYIFFAYLT